MLIYSNLSFYLKESLDFCTEPCHIINWSIAKNFLEYSDLENCAEHFARGNTTHLFPSLLKALITVILNIYELQQVQNLWEC